MNIAFKTVKYSYLPVKLNAKAHASRVGTPTKSKKN